MQNKNLKIKEVKNKKYLNALNKIEKARRQNNVNWMDILRIALKNAPNETIKLMRRLTRKTKLSQTCLKV